jgi:hypothetical protein
MALAGNGLKLAPLMVAWGFSRFYWSVLPWFGKLAVVATVLGGVWWYLRWQVKKRANPMAGSWVLILLLSIAPILVGVGESVRQEYPERELALDQPFSLLTDAIMPSVAGPAILLGVVGYLSMLAVNSKRFRIGAPPLKPMIRGVWTLLVLATLWLAVVWTHWNVIMVQRIGSRDLRPVPLLSEGSWVFVVGWVWTGGIIAAALGFAKKRMSD